MPIMALKLLANQFFLSKFFNVNLLHDGCGHLVLCTHIVGYLESLHQVSSDLDDKN